MYDADLERLDLFDRLARLCFMMTKATHSLMSTTLLPEALEDADRIILQVGENCARKYLKEQHRSGIADLPAPSMIELALEEMLAPVSSDTEILSLQRPEIVIPCRHYYRVSDWPKEPTYAERFSIPHQALRWIRGEEYTHEFLNEQERSPLKAWLDNASSLELVSQPEG